MRDVTNRLELGTILCKHCETLIGTLDSEKVTIYYSECQEQDCLEERVKSGKQPEADVVGSK